MREQHYTPDIIEAPETSKLFAGAVEYRRVHPKKQYKMAHKAWMTLDV